MPQECTNCAIALCILPGPYFRWHQRGRNLTSFLWGTALIGGDHEEPPISFLSFIWPWTLHTSFVAPKNPEKYAFYQFLQTFQLPSFKPERRNMKVAFGLFWIPTGLFWAPNLVLRKKIIIFYSTLLCTGPPLSMTVTALLVQEDNSKK